MLCSPWRSKVIAIEVDPFLVHYLRQNFVTR